MTIQIIVKTIDGKKEVFRNYETDGTDHFTKSWEIIIPEMIEQVINEDEAF